MFATCFNIISGEVFRAASFFCPLAHLDKQMEDEVEEKKNAMRFLFALPVINFWAEKKLHIWHAWLAVWFVGCCLIGKNFVSRRWGWGAATLGRGP